MAFAASAHAQTFKQVATIEIPGTPIKNYGVMTIDQATGLGYLADKDNKAVVVFDTKTDKFVARIDGFVGTTERRAIPRVPTALVVVNGGAELWVSDGDCTIKVVDLKTHKIAATFPTGGKRAPTAWPSMPKTSASSSSPIPMRSPSFSLISTEPGHKILAKLPVPQSAENLERSA